MSQAKEPFSTILTEGALLPPDLWPRISLSQGQRSPGLDVLEGLTPACYHRPGERLNEVINRASSSMAQRRSSPPPI